MEWSLIKSSPQITWTNASISYSAKRKQILRIAYCRILHSVWFVIMQAVNLRKRRSVSARISISTLSFSSALKRTLTGIRISCRPSPKSWVWRRARYINGTGIWEKSKDFFLGQTAPRIVKACPSQLMKTPLIWKNEISNLHENWGLQRFLWCPRSNENI